MASTGNTISASMQVMSVQPFLSRPSDGHLIGPNSIINQLSASALLITATTRNQSVWSLSLICPNRYESQHCTRSVLQPDLANKSTVIDAEQIRARSSQS